MPEEKGACYEWKTANKERMEWDGIEWNGTKKDRMECGGIDIERMISAGKGRSDYVRPWQLS